MSYFDSTSAQPFFVWVRGPRGPEPQKWSQLDFGLHNWKRRLVLAWQPLSHEQYRLSIDDLVRLYPTDKCSHKSAGE